MGNKNEGSEWLETKREKREKNERIVREEKESC